MFSKPAPANAQATFKAIIMCFISVIILAIPVLAATLCSVAQHGLINPQYVMNMTTANTHMTFVGISPFVAVLIAFILSMLVAFKSQRTGYLAGIASVSLVTGLLMLGYYILCFIYFTTYI